jgi:transposase, IS5 family
MPSIKRADKNVGVEQMGTQQSFASLELERRVKRQSALSKVHALINWEALRPLCEGLYKRDQSPVCKGGQTPFDPVMMFKAILLGQWHSLSDPKLEEALNVRIDFIQFCGLSLDDPIPDESTLCRYRNRLIEANRLDKLLAQVNAQLQGHGLMVKNAEAAVIDATLIASAARPNSGHPVIEGQLAEGHEHTERTERSEQTSTPTEATALAAQQPNEEVKLVPHVHSADPDARWVKKGTKYYFGYRAYFAVDSNDGYVRGVHSAPANQSEMRHFAATVDAADFTPKRAYADKGFSSKANRKHLCYKKIKSAIMHKGYRDKPLRERQINANKCMSKTRWIVEQTNGTMKRIFGMDRASYFTTVKVHAQVVLKSVCLNLLKAVNKIKKMELLGESIRLLGAKMS